MAAVKRGASDALVLVEPRTKQSRLDLIASSSHPSQNRTSSLMSQVMLLSGHDGEIYCGKFSPDGSILATSGFDRSIFLWETYDECHNFAVMKGHGGAIMDLHFSTDSSLILTASTDKTLGLWDVETGVRIKKVRGHTSFVNACGLARRGPQLFCSASDDGTVRVFDRRSRNEVQVFQNTYQATCVAFSDTTEYVFSGGIDNAVKAWDLRKKELAYRMKGHTDTVTGISLSVDGSYLLSNAMDNSLRIWDVRAFAPANRCLKTLYGHHHSVDKNLLRCAWSPCGRRVSCGSGDRFVYVWDTTSCSILYKLPGHTGSVNETAFHPDEPIVLSVGSDKKVYLGEIEPSK